MGQYARAIFVYAIIAGYSFLGVGILLNAISNWTNGGRRRGRMLKEMKRPVRPARNRGTWVNTWLPKNTLTQSNDKQSQ
jgi:polyferredoxin